MDPNRFREAFGKLELLDDRLTYRVRNRAKARGTTPEELEQRLRDVAEYVVELKDVMREMMLAIAGKPGDKAE